MKKSLLIGVVFFIFLGLAACKSKIESLSIATGTRTGTYYTFGSAAGRIFSENLNVPVTIQSTGGSKANIELIDAGYVDIAIAQNDVMDYAWRGVELFNGKQIKGFFSMAALYPEVCHVVANPASGIRSITDLRGKIVSVGDEGSGTEFNTRQILEAHGISFDDIIIEHLNFGASADALRDGNIDAFFCVAGVPTPVITELAAVKDIALLDINDLNTSMLIRSYPFYSPASISAGSYPLLESDVKTVAVKATLIVNPNLPEDIVYRLTKLLFEHKEYLAEVDDRLGELSRAYAVEGISVPFHPGAAKYHREMGLIQ